PGSGRTSVGCLLRPCARGTEEARLGTDLGRPETGRQSGGAIRAAVLPCRPECCPTFHPPDPPTSAAGGARRRAALSLGARTSAREPGRPGAGRPGDRPVDRRAVEVRAPGPPP